MKNRFSVLTIAVASILMIAPGCKKKNDHTDVTFVNHINKPVTLDIYATKEDYTENKNRVMRKVLQYNQVLVLSKEELPPNKTYYADWYDDDHYYNNWFNDIDKPAKAFVSFNPVPGNNSYYIEPEFRNNSKIIFLDKSGSSTHWKAVDAYQGSHNISYTSIWNDLAENDRIREVTIRKDFTAVYSYVNAAGTPDTKTYEIKIHNAETGYVQFIDGDNSYMQGGWNPLSTNPEYASTATDTLMALLPGSEYYFMMVKQ